MLTFIVVILILLGLIIYAFELIIPNIQEISIVSLILLFIAGLLVMCAEIENTPQAIDVYRGETTLEITYRDNIPIDSVVVFKNE